MTIAIRGRTGIHGSRSRGELPTLAPAWQRIVAELPTQWSRPAFVGHPLVQHWLCSTTLQPGEIDFLGLAKARGGPAITRWLDRVDDSPLAHLPRDRSGKFSDKTASQIYNVATLMAGSSGDRRSVLEIGAGFGNLSRLLLTSGLVQHVALVDSAPLLALQRWFLEQTVPAHLQEDIRYVDALAPGALHSLCGQSFDLGISTFALTETPLVTQRLYIDVLLSRCARVLIVGQRYFQGQAQQHRVHARLARYFDLQVRDYVFCDVGWPTFELLGELRSECAE